MGIQLGLGLDQPDKHKPNEEIREALIQALTSLLREALCEMPTNQHQHEAAANESETDT